LAEPVRLVMFTQEFECQYCRETRQLVEEVAALSDKIEAEIYNFVIDKEKAEEYNVDKIPAIAVIGAKDYGVRFFGIPSGYEFTSLIEDIITVSQGDSGLSAATREAIAQITEPVHIQVFVTPT
jgi:glutaredoxin-like protein